MPPENTMEPTLDTVIAKILQVFPGRNVEEILSSLARYGTETYEQERCRIYLAILKLCQQENLSDPSSYIEAAKQDYRDVLAWAEYPNQMKFGPTNNPDESTRLRKQDEEQYQAWLNKK